MKQLFLSALLRVQYYGHYCTCRVTFIDQQVHYLQDRPYTYRNAIMNIPIGPITVNIVCCCIVVSLIIKSIYCVVYNIVFQQVNGRSYTFSERALPKFRASVTRFLAHWFICVTKFHSTSIVQQELALQTILCNI